MRSMFVFLMLTNLAHAAAGGTYVLQRQIVLGGPGGWDYMTVDSAAGRLFISRADRVLVMNLQDGSVANTIADTQGVHGIALAPDLGKGFTSNGRADSVTMFDLASLAPLGTIGVTGHNPDAILYDQHSRRVYTFNGRSQDISVIDPLKSVVVATLPAGGKPEFAATDDAGRIYFNIEDTSQMGVIDSTMTKRWDTFPMPDCEEPSGLAFDVAHKRLFSVCGNGVLVVTDAASGRHVATVPIGKGPDAAAFDAGRRLIFSSNGEDGSLSIIHEKDAQSFVPLPTIATAVSARTMSIDPQTGRLYLLAGTLNADDPHVSQQPATAGAQISGPSRVRRSIVPGSLRLMFLDPTP